MLGILHRSGIRIRSRVPGLCPAVVEAQLLLILRVSLLNLLLSDVGILLLDNLKIVFVPLQLLLVFTELLLIRSQRLLVGLKRLLRERLRIGGGLLITLQLFLGVLDGGLIRRNLLLVQLHRIGCRVQLLFGLHEIKFGTLHGLLLR
ncbi:hypothetical protein [Alicyclobacillus fructus]|uniref:hypothetical protein n=1 Tax=Alicyclobacillus fructus TaxID=2816082 RepID=UPI001A8C665D|nr:hypothetical protein [Alicyclobacillus fructus]